MRTSLAAGLVAAVLFRHGAAAHPYPDKMYGVNLGSWLVLEAWMLPQGAFVQSMAKHYVATH